MSWRPFSQHTTRAPLHRGRPWCAWRAVAAVELAIAAPLLLFILLGIIEFGWLFHVKQSLLTASRIGARTATLPAATTAEIRGDVDAAMTGLGFPASRYPYAVDVRRADEASPYEEVELAMRYDDVTLIRGFFAWLNIPEIRVRTTFRREVDGT